MLSCSSSHTPYPLLWLSASYCAAVSRGRNPQQRQLRPIAILDVPLVESAGPPRALGTDRLKDDVGKLLRNPDCVKTARLSNVGFLPCLRSILLVNGAKVVAPAAALWISVIVGLGKRRCIGEDSKRSMRECFCSLPLEQPRFPVTPETEETQLYHRVGGPASDSGKFYNSKI